jgi:hypothetical protein
LYDDCDDDGNKMELMEVEQAYTRQSDAKAAKRDVMVGSRPLKYNLGVGLQPDKFG